MKNSKRHAVALSLLMIMSATILFANANPDAKADAIWTVGSQISDVAASDDNVYVLWQNNSPDHNVYFRRSADGGATFGETIRLSNALSGYAADPKMAVSGNNVYVAWMDATTPGSNSTVLFRRSTDGGNTFESAQVLSTNTKRSSGIQQLFALENNVYALMIDEWSEGNSSYYYDSTFRLSRDNGKTFGEPISLLPAPSHSNLRGVSSIATSPSGDMVYAVGVDYGDCRPEQRICDDNARIFFKRSTDGGNTFSDDKTIERPPGIVTKSTSERRAIAPTWVQVAADRMHVGIVWGEFLISQERESIFLAQSSDGGETFGAPVPLDAGAKGSSDWPLLLSSSDSMFVAWNDREDNKSMPHIGLVRINADGSFSKPTDATGKISIPIWDVAASGNSVHIVGSSNTRNTGSGLPDGVDVYFFTSTDAGNSFEDPVDLSDDHAIKTLLAAQQKSLSFVNPMLAISGKHVYVGWQASYPDSHEIYIRASDDGGRTFGKIASLNEKVDDPVSRGLAILTSTSAVYTIVIVAGAIAAGAFGILIAKRRKTT